MNVIPITPIAASEEIESLLRQITAITSPEESIALMKRIFMNFDTSPHLYTKKDYFDMLVCFYKHFKYFMEHDVTIVTQWNTVLSDSVVPSEKLTKTTIDTKQDTLIAGTNILIAADGKTISATDTTYTAGTAINIADNVISVNVVSSFQQTPDNNHIPSEKLVKDTIDQATQWNYF